MAVRTMGQNTSFVRRQSATSKETPSSCVLHSTSRCVFLQVWVSKILWRGNNSRNFGLTFRLLWPPTVPAETFCIQFRELQGDWPGGCYMRVRFSQLLFKNAGSDLCWACFVVAGFCCCCFGFVLFFCCFFFLIWRFKSIHGRCTVSSMHTNNQYLAYCYISQM